MTDTRKNTAPHDTNRWETGALGQSEEHVRVATDAEMREVDGVLGLPKTPLRQRTGFHADKMSVPEARQDGCGRNRGALRRRHVKLLLA